MNQGANRLISTQRTQAAGRMVQTKIIIAIQYIAMTNIAYAKLLRTRSTPVEAKLWQHLRDRRFMGLKFRNAEQQEYDAIRTEFLSKLGYRVLRFWNHDVLNQFDVVMEHIYSVLFDPPSSG